MARGKKTGGKDFQPGNNLGKGRPPLPPDLKEARKLNQVELERIVNKCLWLDRAGLQELVKDPATSMMEVMVASIVAQAAQKGDQLRLEFILQRMIGKVQERIQHSVVEPFVLNKLDGGQVVVGAKVNEPSEGGT